MNKVCSVTLCSERRCVMKSAVRSIGVMRSNGREVFSYRVLDLKYGTASFVDPILHDVSQNVNKKFTIKHAASWISSCRCNRARCLSWTKSNQKKLGQCGRALGKGPTANTPDRGVLALTVTRRSATCATRCTRSAPFHIRTASSAGRTGSRSGSACPRRVKAAVPGGWS